MCIATETAALKSSVAALARECACVGDSQANGIAISLVLAVKLIEDLNEQMADRMCELLRGARA